MDERGLIEPALGPGVRACFTTNQFDLATLDGRRALSRELSLPLVFARQVHGAEVRWVGPGSETAELPTGDALATGAVGIGLVIRTADCLPLLLADPRAGLAAAVHVGWRGLMAGVAEAAVAELRSAGAANLLAALGPSICPNCYQVGPDLAAAARQAGHVTGRGADGTPRLDLAGSVAARLRRAGLRAIWRSPECTLEDDRFFSWRAARDTGRQGGVIALEPPPPPSDRPTRAPRLPTHAGEASRLAAP
ncbi:MAG: polyphenol oxidase family protein [Bifidobacteriaceae bacterium]|nr:polyphenol oxidase family protein [Bifidobacteriaceae bacterium]